jgi:hypothetical protein
MKTEHLDDKKEKYIFQDGADLMCGVGMLLMVAFVLLWLLGSYLAPIVRHMIGG